MGATLEQEKTQETMALVSMAGGMKSLMQIFL